MSFTKVARQLKLFSNNKVSYDPHDYIILEENRQLYNAVMHDISWKCIIIFGPQGSGKTHLAHVWQSTNSAIFINVNNFISDIRYSNAFILEDMQEIEDEEMLLHCYNYVKENNKRLLITSSVAPSKLNLRLNDLSSRILSTPSVKILPASEELLRVMLIKRFSDNQLKIDLKVINYILTRMAHSCYSINKIMDEVDKNLHTRTGITITFIRSLLDFSKE